MYYVKSWDTNRVLPGGEIENLAQAKKFARAQGHTGEDWEGFTGYPPVAFVANSRGECVYNPRFPKPRP